MTLKLKVAKDKKKIKETKDQLNAKSSKILFNS